MEEQDYSETYDTRTRRATDAYIRDLWARAGLDEQGEPLPPGVTGRRSQYTPSTVYSDSLFDDSLVVINTCASTPSHLAEAAMSKAFEKYRGEEDGSISPITMGDALGRTRYEYFSRGDYHSDSIDLGAVGGKVPMEGERFDNNIEEMSRRLNIETTKVIEMLEMMSASDVDRYENLVSPTPELNLPPAAQGITEAYKGAPNYTMAQVDNPSHSERQQRRSDRNPELYEGSDLRYSSCGVSVDSNKPHAGILRAEGAIDNLPSVSTQLDTNTNPTLTYSTPIATPSISNIQPRVHFSRGTQTPPITLYTSITTRGTTTHRSGIEQIRDKLSEGTKISTRTSVTNSGIYSTSTPPTYSHSTPRYSGAYGYPQSGIGSMQTSHTLTGYLPRYRYSGAGYPLGGPNPIHTLPYTTRYSGVYSSLDGYPPSYSIIITFKYNIWIP